MKKVTADSVENRALQEELRELEQQDWSNMWTFVMHQLRTGLRLKKVDYSRTPIEFELTPYEMLMDDIRGKKFQLNQVEIPAKTRSDARDLILDFIRSRPPLRPVSQRQLKALRKESTPGELLMQDIRSFSAQKSLRKTNAQQPIRSAFQESSRTELLLDSGDSQPPLSSKAHRA